MTELSEKVRKLHFRIVLYFDLSGYTAMILSLGDERARELVIAQLYAVVRAMQAADPTVEAHRMEGDSVFLTGTDLAAILRCAIKWQEDHAKGDSKNLAFRMAIGLGDHETRPSEVGQFNIITGVTIVLSAALLMVCRDGGIVITEGAHAALRGIPDLTSRMTRRVEWLKGTTRIEPFYEVTGLGKVRRTPIRMLLRYNRNLRVVALIIAASLIANAVLLVKLFA